jgi:hypothetical protein
MNIGQSCNNAQARSGSGANTCSRNPISEMVKSVMNIVRTLAMVQRNPIEWQGHKLGKVKCIFMMHPAAREALPLILTASGTPHVRENQPEPDY